MKTRSLPGLILAAALLLAVDAAGAEPAKAESATALALKKVADRYALTKSRIAALLDARVHPSPLPAKLPNPFYRVPELPLAENPAPGAETVVVPAAADISDADTLAKFAAGIKISGLIMVGESPHLTINSTLCKAGDVIPAGTKVRPLYIQVQAITPDELTLRLNDATQVIQLRR